ncbi:MAG: hypothetical protein RLN89_08525 [Parvibaculum sp.]
MSKISNPRNALFVLLMLLAVLSAELVFAEPNPSEFNVASPDQNILVPANVEEFAANAIPAARPQNASESPAAQHEQVTSGAESDPHLIAQQTMANAAETQSCLVAIGTVLLFLTLILTWLAHRSALDALNVTKKSFQTQLRAYVFPSGTTALPYKSLGTGRIDSWLIHFNFKNSGPTPTLNASGMLNWRLQWSKEDLPPEFGYPDEEPAVNWHYAPFEEQNAGPVKLEISAAIDAWKKQMRIFVWGWIEYNDVFPETERHRTEFSGELFVTADPTSDAFNCFIFQPSGPFNGHDDTCFRRPATLD